jgi:branched-chain amino acid transport system substrate-binding protein
MRRWFKFAAAVIATVLIAGCVQPGEKAPKKAEIEVPLGVLVDLSGPLTTHGEDIKNTVTIAAEDINNKFEKDGRPYRIKLYVEDTKADPKIALDKIMALQTQGVKLIVGPQSSGEVKNIIGYVGSNKIIVASPSSTAETKYLGVTAPDEKKYVFRIVPTDSFQTKAIAKLAHELGVKAVVITYIGNAWGKGLEEFGKAEFQKQGIEVKNSVEYPDPTPADFTPYISTIEENVNTLMKNYTKDQIAVVAFSYEEIATMLAQTQDNSVLLNVKWIGCDGITKSSKIIADVPGKANKIKLYSTVSETRGRKEFDDLNSTYHQRTGSSPMSYGLNAYDTTWLLALSFAQVYDKQSKYNDDAIVEAVPKVAGEYSTGKYGIYPVSGEVKLNEYKDRIGLEYRIYAVSNGSWNERGAWKFATNEIKWS